MTVNYTTNLSLGQPVTGTESGTWGDDVNNSVTSYLDIAIAGGLAITITTTDVTLSITQGTSSATNIGSTTAQYAILNVSGAMTAARNLILPSSSRQYVINNNTTGGFALTVKGSATSGVTMVNGEKAHVFWNGSDYAKVSNSSGAGTFSSITNTGLTSGRVVYSTTGGLETDSANLTFDGTTLSAAGLSDSGNLTFTGTGNRITGDFTNATLANRLMLQTSTANSASRVGILPNGTSAAAELLVLNNSDTTNAGFGSIRMNASDFQITATYNGAGTYLPMTFYTGGSERMRLDTSGNVGIGGVPSNRLQVANGNASQVRVSEQTLTYYFDFGRDNTDGLFSINGNQGLGYKWKNNGTEVMRIDSSGNVGVGTSTPASYGKFSVYNANINGTATFLHPGNTSFGTVVTIATYGGTDSPAISFNNYNGGSPVYYSISENSSGALLFNSGGYVSSVGTERMRIDNAGNVGIGTNAPAVKLQVSGAFAVSTNASGSLPSTSPGGLVISQNYTGGSAGAAEIDFFYNDSTYVGDNGGFRFYQKTGASTAQEMLRLTQNTVIAYTGGSERMRIDSSGNVLVATTNTAPGNGSGNNVSGFAVNTNGTTWASRSGFEALSVNRVDTTGGVLRAASAGTQVGGISVTSSATAFNTSSDYRLKENIAPMTGALIKVAALKPVTYKWKRDGSNGEGFIAHELAEVCPQAVTGAKDAVDADGNPEHQGIDTSFLVATLTAAIQEQQALIASLTARIEALESR